MSNLRRLRGTVLLAVLPALLIGAVTTAARAATPPVSVTFAVNGDPTPGATVTAKATITINDGSTLQALKWSQLGGVPVTLANTTIDTVTITLPSRKVFREGLMTVLEEAPLTNAQLPANVPPLTVFEGGLQNRWGIAAVSPLALEEAGAIALDAAVTTSSGTYHSTATVASNLPWDTAIGARNVPTLLPVALHGKTQASYDWKLTAPTGSAAALIDANTQNPEFTPDVPGTFVLTVTDLATAKPVTLTVYAGTWKGIITGQDVNGRPTVGTECTGCHVQNTPHFDLFTPWAQSGHAEIFTQNVNVAGHYSASCLSCHTVGYSAKNVKNGGIDDAIDWSAFLSTDLLTHGAAGNWTKILSTYPQTARLANIQCENCHGPQDSAAHMKKDDSRMTLSSDLCGTCHGEPARHGRYQQWQLSAHANYETAVAEGTNPSCAKCHSAQGFLQWQDKGFSSTASITVDWTAEDVHPQTCQTCHDPHAVGTTSGGPTTNATVRISGTTPMLDAGFVAKDVGSAAICMTCHNGRRGLKNDLTYSAADASRAPHVGPQADIIMGQNLFFTAVGTPGFHSKIQDSCVTCHMENTNPPAGLAYKNADGTFGGTNHTFYASTTICSKCHSTITADSVQGVVEAKLENLKARIETAIKNVMQAQIRAGNSINFNNARTVRNAADISAIEFIESHGRQGISTTFTDGSKIADLSLQSVKVVRPAGSAVELLAAADPALAKAGWNYFMVESDKSKGVHNPAFVNSALDVSIFAVNAVNTAVTTAAPGANAAIGGGIGNGAGAVSCTTPYVYWTEVAGHFPGAAGSQWRTDLIARNLDSSTAHLRFVLHQPTGNLEGTGAVAGGAQNAFEDLIASMGGANNVGSLEICSDRPLLVTGRVFNQSDTGTFGQNLDGRVADLGYGAGQTVNLIGLRQKTGAYRSNIVVTNGGATEAQVTINLFDATGTSLKSYPLTIPASAVMQDTEPFKNRANAPDVGWGFATVTVTKGSNVITSASMIDMNTNDPATIPAKQ